jgi:chromosome segregation ATPase
LTTPGQVSLKFDSSKGTGRRRSNWTEDKLDNNDTSPGERKSLEEALAQVKQNYQAHANDEQEAQSKVSEAEEQLRIEEAKLSDLKGRLERLNKDLDNRQPPVVVSLNFVRH